MKGRGERVVVKETTAEGLTRAGDELDYLECLQAADDAAHRAEDARFAAIGNAAGCGWFGEEAAVARTAVSRVEDGDLALEAKDAPVNERAAGEKGGVVVKITRGEIIGTIEDDIVLRKQIAGIFWGDAVGMDGDVNERVGELEAASGGGDFGFADGSIVVEELALEVMGFDVIEVGEAQSTDAGGGEVEGRGTAEPASADDEDAGGGEALLTGEADLREQEMPVVTRELGRREGGRRGHGGKTEWETASSQLKLRSSRGVDGMRA